MRLRAGCYSATMLGPCSIVTQYARLLGVAPQYVRRMISRGRLHAVRIGSQWAISPAARIARARRPGPPSRISPLHLT